MSKDGHKTQTKMGDSFLSLSFSLSRRRKKEETAMKGRRLVERDETTQRVMFVFPLEPPPTSRFVSNICIESSSFRLPPTENKPIMAFKDRDSGKIRRERERKNNNKMIFYQNVFLSSLSNET